MKKSSLLIVLSLLSGLSASPLQAQEETGRDWLDRGDARTFMALDAQKGIVEGGAGAALENFRQAVDCYVKAGENGAPTRDYWARFPAAIVVLSSLSPAEAAKEADRALAFMESASICPAMTGLSLSDDDPRPPAPRTPCPDIFVDYAWALAQLSLLSMRGDKSADQQEALIRQTRKAFWMMGVHELDRNDGSLMEAHASLANFEGAIADDPTVRARKYDEADVIYDQFTPITPLNAVKRATTRSALYLERADNEDDLQKRSDYLEQAGAEIAFLESVNALPPKVKARYFALAGDGASFALLGIRVNDVRGFAVSAVEADRTGVRIFASPEAMALLLLEDGGNLQGIEALLSIVPYSPAYPVLMARLAALQRVPPEALGAVLAKRDAITFNYVLRSQEERNVYGSLWEDDPAKR